MQRKLVKIAKKLKKLWPGKKRKKLHPPPPPVTWIKEPPPPQLEYYHLPPPPYDFHFPSSFQPSAPPLPPWLDLELKPEPDPTEADESLLLLSHTTSSSSYPSSSYQQYTVPTPDYGALLAQHPNARKPRSGFFGCVVGFVVNVFGCFCPCLRITEVR